MEQYIFLFVLAFAWIIFAVVQDLRTREIANWLNFSLISFVLAYRAFYSIFTGNWEFFFLGLGGIIIFVFLGYVFYYTKVFAGGDAKLLFGLGGVLPYQSTIDYWTLGLGFIFVLFLVGVLYSTTYSLFLVLKKKKEFRKGFVKNYNKERKWVYWSIVLFWSVSLVLLIGGFGAGALWFLVFPLFMVLYVYSKTVEKVCMVKLLEPKNLREGDWLEKDVRDRGRVIKKSVHGLSMKDIEFLRESKKKVLIKEGVPFSPAFLFTFIVMVLYVLA
jgi:Flp pilus assembly protein protease CpaA